METHLRECRLLAVQNFFDTPESDNCDDVESASEEEDYVEMQINESDEEAKLDYKQMTIAGEGTSETLSTPVSVEPPNKRTRVCERYLYSKTNFKWSRKPPESCTLSLKKYIGTPKGKALNVKTPLEAWSLFFDDDILNIILTHTNEEIDQEIARMTRSNINLKSYHKTVQMIELMALIGLLYFAGAQKVNHIDIRELWSPYGMSIFRITMPQSRFKFLLLCLRFDDKNTRAERKENDRLANIREVWNKFITNCTANYEPHSNCTIGKQLLPFRGKCIFRTYLSDKSDRYGLKILTLNDATTYYLYNAIPYCGSIMSKNVEDMPSYYVRKLSEPIYHSGRNITCDDWFTSIPICEKMLKDYNITMVGKLHKSRREIPEEFKKLPPSEANVQFAYNDDKVLVSYVLNKKSVVQLLSSYHVSDKINEDTGEPEIVLFYHNTKDGADSFEKKCQDFTTSRKTRKWPMRYFYGMLDQANVNSSIIYSLLENTLLTNRKDYILDLSMALIKPFLSQRLTYPTLRTILRVQIEHFLDYKNFSEEQNSHDFLADNKMPKQRRCGFCPSSLDRKTAYMCLRCEIPMCKGHTAKICSNCSVQMSN